MFFGEHTSSKQIIAGNQKLTPIIVLGHQEENGSSISLVDIPEKVEVDYIRSFVIFS